MQVVSAFDCSAAALGHYEHRWFSLISGHELSHRDRCYDANVLP